jgi:hypothetical protein
MTFLEGGNRMFLPIVEIVRLEENFQFGTFGVMKLNKELFCVTLELPDLLNKSSASSIPAQQYICERYSSDKYTNTFIVTNVPGRSFVLFHPGNRKKDTRGCILTAQFFAKLQGDWFDRGVWNSGATFEKFMAVLKDHNKFHLTISEVY